MSALARDLRAEHGGRARSSPTPPPNSASSSRRPEGVPREVYLLTGGRPLAPLVPSVAVPPAGAPKPRAKRYWERVPFKASPSEKAPTLTHWAPRGQPQDSYAFSRFDRPVRMLTYTSEEYTACIHDLMPLNVDPKLVPPSKKSQKATSERSRSSRKSGSGEKEDLDTKTKEAGSEKKETAEKEKNVENLAVVDKVEKSDEKGNEKQTAVEKVAGVGVPQSPVSLRQALHYVPPQKPWTREETDTLFELCQRFDLRFAVVHDRWPDSLDPRTIDELKDRYYSVAKRIVEYRTRSNKDALSSLPLALQKHCQAITMNPFDYEYECIRKNQLEWQYRRSKLELREEEETVREARRIEANRKRLTKERQRLAKLLAPAADMGVSDGKRGVDQALAAAAAAASMPQKTFPHRKIQSGAYARSSQIYTPISQSARVAKRIDTALVDLGVGTRPTPTSIVVDNFDLLRMDILAYIELQRTVMRKEEDVHSLRVKLAKLKGEPPPPPPPGVTLSHKKRRLEDAEMGSLFSAPAPKKRATSEQ